MAEHDSTPVEGWLDSFRRDRQPEGEIRIWEEIVDVYLEEIRNRPLAVRDERELVYRALVSASMLTPETFTEGNVLSVCPAVKQLNGLSHILARFRERKEKPD